MFKPKGDRSLRVIIAELAAVAPHGSILLFADLAEAIGATDDEAGRAQVRQVVSAARRILLADHHVALIPVRRQGYRIAEPGEFAGVAQEHRRRADRSIGRALAVVENAPLEDMTPAERKRHDAVSLVLRNLHGRMTSAEQRLADLETMVYGPPRKIVKSELAP